MKHLFYQGSLENSTQEVPGGNQVLTEVEESKIFNPLEVKYQF